MTLDQYIDNLNRRFIQGNATEHTFRGDLQQLVETLQPEISATNEPKRQKCGAPDYILAQNDVPVGFIEAKDVGDGDLDGLKKSGNKEQFDRYKASLENLIFTDYIDFHWYKDGELVMEVSIGKIKSDKIVPSKESFDDFEVMMNQFCSFSGQTIKSAKRLAEMMAGKARLLADIIEKSLDSDEENEEDSSLKAQFAGFEQVLIKDIKSREFADVYAQTIAYGMFAARLYDDTLDTFSRQEAAELIPKSNPFLRKLFSYIAGVDIDDRIKWIVDSLADIFKHTNIRKILEGYGRTTKTEDPIIHFYETFLTEYDASLRKTRGVWYTPHPVVNFIIRAVDDILKTGFGLGMGLADNSKVKIKTKVATHDKRSKTGYKEYEKEVHRVQLLDPATGTGTFLVEFIKEIFRKFKGQEGLWSEYVEKHLIPRLNGFELLMASYAMAHLKLDLVLKETGFKPGTTPGGSQKNQRLKVFLTNSLEAPKTEDINLFMAQWLSQEAIEADEVKTKNPVMVVAGNPPYSGESVNKSEWVMNLMNDYKKEPGGKEKLKERNPKWINDDYVKFMRYGQHYIEKNGSGILAYINPHGFLDNPTFRGMRWNLLKTFDKIYTIDLHGNSKKKETTPNGGIDENVFDIQQGVSINILVKTGNKKPKELGKVFHYDLYGKRDSKYDFLSENSIKSINFTQLPNVAPMYYMVQKGFEAQIKYDKGFSLNELFIINGVGLTTAHDEFVIKENKKELLDYYKKFQSSPRDAEFLHKEFNVRKKTGWDILQGYDNIKNEIDLKKYIEPISYRPFDNRFVFYEDKLVWRTVRKVMVHFLEGENIGLVFRRQQPQSNDLYVFCSNYLIADGYIRSDSKGGESIAPLYLYPATNAQQAFNHETEDTPATPKGRVPNLNKQVVQQIAKKLDLEFVPDHEMLKQVQHDKYFTPSDLLDYIYAVLHSPNYRETYKEFLKIDFPRIPYPKEKDTFWQLVKLGGEIRQLHLLESATLDNYITSYPVSGSNEITRKMTKSSIGFELTDEEEQSGKVWINNQQYFDNVPLVAWEFYIGGYQPAQKWLKDRKMRTLNFEDIIHYQKMIVALTETDRLMKEIDKIEFV